MKNRPISTLGFKDLSYDVPSDASEFDTLAGRVGACVDEANANVVYRGTLTDFRAAFLHGLHVGEGEGAIDIKGVEEITGIERNREQLKDKEGKPREDKNGDPITKFTETEDDYFNRVLSTLASQNSSTVEGERAKFRDLAQQVLSSDPLAFDPKREERLPAGPKKVPAIYLKVAQKIVDGGKAESSAAKLTAQLGYQVDQSVEAIGRAIAEVKRRERANEDLAAQFS